MKRRDGTPLWVRQRTLPGHTKEGKAVVYGTLQDMTEEKEQQEQLNKIGEILKNVPAGILVFRLSEGHFSLVDANPAICRMMGIDHQRAVGANDQSVLSLTHPDDVCIVEDAARALSVPGTQVQYEYRSFFRSRGEYVWVSGHGASVKDADGSVLAFVSFTDITAQKKLDDKVRKSEQALQDAIRHNGIDFWTVDFATHQASFGREMMARYHLQADTEPFPDALLAGGFLYPGENQAFTRYVSRVFAGEAPLSWECRTLDECGRHYLWRRVTATLSCGADGRPETIIFTARSIQERKQLEQYYVNAESRTEAWTWELDVAARTIYAIGTSKKAEEWPLGEVVANVPEALVASGLYAKESEQPLRDMYNKIIAGADYAEALVYRWSQPHQSMRWLSSSITRVDDGTVGGSQLAVVLSRDVTSEKLLEQRYEMELASRKNLSENVLATCHVNLSQGKVVEYWNRYGEQMTKQMETAVDYCDRVSATLENVTLNQEGMQDFSAKAMKEAFLRGQTTLEADYLATEKRSGRRRWIHQRVNLMAASLNGDIMAFSYVEDVTNSVMSSRIAQALAENNYDMIGYIVAASGRLYLQRTEKEGQSIYTTQGLYRDVLFRSVSQRVPVEERRGVLKRNELTHVIAQLKEKGTYEDQYHYLSPDRRLRSKQLRYSFSDDTHEFIIVARTDNTDLLAQAEEKQQQLQALLQAAKVASQAKTEFLSRMSHEIRTPMNAIMGLAAVAAENKNDYVLVQDSLDKINISAKYLLTLINDILEMSRIESGKIDIHHTDFAFSDLLSSVQTIIVPLAKQSGLRYDLSVKEGCYAVYTGDMMRIQQVLVNILSNAVKFTPEGGRVRLSAETVGEENQTVQMRFTVEDTGIGISEAFLPHLFDAFSQANSGNKTAYGGSGLGMAITKHIVDAMGGQISVESFEKIGTTFSVTIPLKRAEEAKTEAAPALPGTPAPEGDLHGCSILMAEDHPLNVTVARRLLERKGITVTVANNGQEAVDMFASAEPGTFNMILMDIRMPVMDGLEATRAIRALDRPDAHQIPIIAMTANALDEDRRNTHNAGMNEHIAKPIDPRILYSTISKYYKKE